MCQFPWIAGLKRARMEKKRGEIQVQQAKTQSVIVEWWK